MATGVAYAAPISPAAVEPRRADGGPLPSIGQGAYSPLAGRPPVTQHRKYDADQALSDADQVAANADQQQSNAGRAASDSDQASADADQVASNLDQYDADQAYRAIPNPSETEVRVYEKARIGRIKRTLERLRTRVARRNATDERDVTALARDQTADERDARGRIRDSRER